MSNRMATLVQYVIVRRDMSWPLGVGLLINDNVKYHDKLKFFFLIFLKLGSSQKMVKLCFLISE